MKKLYIIYSIYIYIYYYKINIIKITEIKLKNNILYNIKHELFSYLEQVVFFDNDEVVYYI